MPYQPAANLTTSAGLRQQIATYYNRVGLDQLMAIFRFREVFEPDVIPKRNGKTIQWYRFDLLGASTTPATEGTVGTSLTFNSNVITATLAEYADFASWSTLLEETDISDDAVNFSKILSYRAGLSVDTIARIELDSAIASVGLSTLGATLTVQDFRRVGALLGAANIRMGPRGDANYRAIIHPYAKYDLVSDNTAGGFIDLLKYTSGKTVMAGEVGMVDNFRVVETTNVGTSGTAPNVLYYCYMVGQGAAGAVDLPGSGPSKVTNPKNQSFKITVLKGGPSQSDPEGMIGGYASYRFVTVHKLLDTTNYRYRIVKADASLV